MVASGSRTMIAGSLYPAVSLVSINPESSHNRPARDARALAQGRLSLLLALEVAPMGGLQIETKLRALIRRMSMENPLWGAPRTSCATSRQILRSAPPGCG